MSNVNKDGDYYTDNTGRSFQTSDGKPLANEGVKIKISDTTGGQSSGTWSNGQAVPDKR
jgi:hypothetical protein